MNTTVPAVRAGHRVVNAGDIRREIVKPRRLRAMPDPWLLAPDSPDRLPGGIHRLGHHRRRGTERINRITELIDRHRTRPRTGRLRSTHERARDKLAHNRRLRQAAAPRLLVNPLALLPRKRDTYLFTG